MATVAAAAAADPVATKTEPTFQRGRHLAFAVIGLVHAPLVAWSGAVFVSRLGDPAWSPEIATIHTLGLLCFAAFVAWLAFAVFNTGAEVYIHPRRWGELGVMFVVWCIGQELFSVYSAWQASVERPHMTSLWVATFSEYGDLRFGWLALAVLAAAAAEEIVYRALLLTAFEGYMRQERALVLHAVVFELVHAFVYGRGFTGIWFIGGIVLGYAFQRTRSLAVPTLLHAAHNLLFFTAVWYFNQ